MPALVADPPWRFSDRLPGVKRGAEKHYNCLSLDEICDFTLPELPGDCYLFMWRVSAMVEEAYRVTRAWGFVPKTELVWQKTTKTGKRHFGMGHHLRAEHESCVVAVRGKPKPLVRNIRSILNAPVGRHSEKPDAFYRLVESFTSPPYVELFARRRRSGWAHYGDEL